MRNDLILQEARESSTDSLPQSPRSSSTQSLKSTPAPSLTESVTQALSNTTSVWRTRPGTETVRPGEILEHTPWRMPSQIGLQSGKRSQMEAPMLTPVATESGLGQHTARQLPPQTRTAPVTATATEPLPANSISAIVSRALAVRCLFVIGGFSGSANVRTSLQLPVPSDVGSSRSSSLLHRRYWLEPILATVPGGCRRRSCLYVLQTAGHPRVGGPSRSDGKASVARARSPRSRFPSSF